MIAVVDYGMGNLRSVEKALERVGAEVCVTDDPEVIAAADKVVLPGVGAMGAAVRRLEERTLIPVIRRVTEQGRPFLGICLGLQLLFETSAEGEETRGLGLLPGRVERFQGPKVPHMGWNRLETTVEDPLWKGLPEETYVYFCHSYYVLPADRSVVSAWSDYGGRFAAAVRRDNVMGVQFHPEKSQTAGLRILRNFVEVCG